MTRCLLNAQAINEALQKIAEQIYHRHPDHSQTALLGIRNKGTLLAHIISEMIEHKCGFKLPVGTIDTSLYRDDVSGSPRRPVLCHTEMAFTVTDQLIILVDDVLYTGRTIRAALDAVMDIGRPKAIELAVLIDRGNRELPIQPNYTGQIIPTDREDNIKVVIDQQTGQHQVFLSQETNPKKW